MPRRWHPVDPREPVDDAVRDAVRLARERRDENAARLTLYPTPDLEVRATTQMAPAPLPRPEARPAGG